MLHAIMILQKIVLKGKYYFNYFLFLYVNTCINNFYIPFSTTTHLFTSFTQMLKKIISLVFKDRADSSGNEGGTAGNTDPELGGTNSDGQQQQQYHHQQQQLQQHQSTQQNTSPPKDLPISSSSDKRKTIFRTSSNTPSSAKKKQSLSFTTEPPKISTLEACLSPTNVEPRKSLLEQLSRTFATIDETVLPEVVAITGPPEPFIHRITSLLTTNIRPNIILFQAQNTAEIKAILQSIMNKIQK